MADAAAHHRGWEAEGEQRPRSGERSISPAHRFSLWNFKSSGQSCWLSFFDFFFFSEAWRKVKVWGRLSDRNLSTFFPVCARIYLISQLPMEEGWTEGLLEIRFAYWPETVLRIQSPPLPSLAWFNHIKELLLVLSDERFRQKTSSV